MRDLNDRLNRIRITTFASELGWAAVAVDGEGTLHRLWLGYPTAEAIDARIVADHPPGERVRWDRRGTPAAKRLVELIRRYARGERIDFRVVPLIEPAGTTFQRRVMSLTRDIPYGEALSYRQVAERAGSPHAARAVGTVMAQNPLPLVIPCHRVIASNRRLGGYSGGGGVATKRRLLQLEGIDLSKPVRAKPRRKIRPGKPATGRKGAASSKNRQAKKRKAPVRSERVPSVVP